MILAIGDDRFWAPGRRYRSVPLLPLDYALSLETDAYVVANSSAVHGTDTYNRLASLTSRPVHHWFGLSEKAEAVDISSSKGAYLAEIEDAEVPCVVTG